MISKRSMWLASAAVLVLTQSSCLFSDHSGTHVAAVKDQSTFQPAHARSSTHTSSVSEPEYFEGLTPPETPAAPAETRPSAPSPAHVWVAGEQTRRDGAWVWSAGRYVLPPSADVVWVPGHWVSHLHGYVWIDGAWR